MRSSVHVAAVILLVLVSVVVAAALWLYLSSFKPSRVPRMCHLVAEAATANESGVYLWLRSLDCKVHVDIAYLEYPDGTLAAVLRPFPGNVTLLPGEARAVRLLPSSEVNPGEYILEVPYSEDPLILQLRTSRRIPRAPEPLHGFFDELNGTVVDTGKVILVINVTVYEEVYDTYMVTVRLCAKKGYTIYYDRIEVYNASMKPPMWVGKWYVFVEPGVPFTYPNCSIADFYPVWGGEQPITILAMYYARP